MGGGTVVLAFVSQAWGPTAAGPETAGLINLLSKEDCRSEIVAQAEDFRYSIIPIQILGVDIEKLTTRDRTPGRVEDVKGTMDKLAEFAETFIN